MNDQLMIHKYRLAIGTNSITLPRGAAILSTDMQNEGVYVWALVNADSVFTDERIFEVFMTGQLIGALPGTRRKFIGTVLLQGRCFVVHVFERIT